MSIIDHSYSLFTEGIYLVDSTPKTDSLVDSVCKFVENKMLRKLFGIYLFNDFNTNIVNVKYVTLINGLDSPYIYDSNNLQYKFEGLKPMLANFVICFLPSFQRTNNVSSGEAEAKIANFDLMVSKTKQLAAWNDAVVYYYEAIDYINYMNGLTPDTYANFLPDNIEKDNSFGI
jgi:hypothetical protein